MMEERLEILCQGGVIDRDICQGIKTVMTRLEIEWNIPVRHEQGDMAMTHMANALMRSRRGEVIAPLDEALMAEVADAEVYPRLRAIHQALLSDFDVTLHPNEEGYLLANLFGLWQAGNER